MEHSHHRSHSLPTIIPPPSTLVDRPPRYQPKNQAEQETGSGNPEDILSRFERSSEYGSAQSSLPSSVLLSPLTAKRSVLAEAYSQQITHKQAQRQNQHRLRLNEERDMLSQLAEQQEAAKRMKKEKKERERMEALEDMQRREAIRESQRPERPEIRKENKLVRQNSLQNKLVSFHSFYNNQLKASEKRDQVYLNFMERQKKRKEENQVSDREYMRMKHQMIERQIAEETKARIEQKNSLRSILDRQLQQQQASRIQQKIESKQSPFQGSPGHRHNPITNPIDYQIDISNPYLIRQLAQQPH